MASKPEQMAIQKIGSKKKKWIIGSVIIIIVLALLGTAMASSILAKVAPDKYVLLSMLEMKKLAEKETSNSHLSYPKNRKTSLALNLKEIDGVNDDYFKEVIQGSGISLSVANSQSGDLMVDAGFQKNGTSLMDLSLYSSNQQLGLKISGLLDQYVMIDLTQFKQQYDQSNFSSYMGNIEQEDVDLVNHYVSQIRNTINGGVVEIDSQFNDDIDALLMDLIKNATVKQIGSTKVLIDNKTKAAHQFSIIIDSEEVKALIKGISKSAIHNTDFIDHFLTYQNHYTKEEIEQNISNALDEIKLSDVEITCAIDNKKRIVNTEINTAIDVNDEKLNIKSKYMLSGSDSTFNKAEANLTLDSEYEKIQFDLERDKKYSDRKTKTSEYISINIIQDKEQILKASWNLEQDSKAKEDNLVLTSNITLDNDTHITFKILGDLLVNKGTKESSLDANKIELKADAYGDVFSIIGSGSFKVEDLRDQSFALSDAQQLDLFSIGIGQMFDIATRVRSQFYELGNILNYIY
ncbi:MAG TPA: hypothetical protein GX707_16995 [Epulopiscium sp.]|nr:hypothetical protein [Candidatus Epulonipiscium sp.]